MGFEEAESHEERGGRGFQVPEFVDGRLGHESVGQVFVVLGDELHQLLVSAAVLAVESVGVGEEDSPSAFPGAVRSGQFAPGMGHLVAAVALAVVLEDFAVRRMGDLADEDRAVTASAEQLGHGLSAGGLLGSELRRTGVHGVVAECARAGRAASGEQGIAGRSAGGHLNEVVGEQHALGGQPIEVGALHVVQSITTKFGSQVINGNEQNVGAILLCLRGSIGAGHCQREKREGDH